MSEKEENSTEEIGTIGLEELAIEVVLHWPHRKTRSKRPRHFSSGEPVIELDFLQNWKETGDILSNYGDRDDEEVSEASTERYASIVTRELSDYEIVEVGPLVVKTSRDNGIYILSDLVIHMNIKVKQKDVPDAVVETFFCELTETNTNVVSVGYVSIVGPSNSLPEKAETYDCLYCCSHNIHHPDYPSDTFRNGREYRWTTLRSQVGNLCKFIKKGKKERNFNPRFSHPGLQYIGKCGLYTKSGMTSFYMTALTDNYETALTVPVALSFYNAKEGTNFEFVKIGPFGSAHNEMGRLVHLNFEAKNKDDPNAELQTFFAEALINCTCVLTEFCICLGPSHLLSGKNDLRGCVLCTQTHHPPGPGYLNGREYFELFEQFECGEQTA